VTARRATTLQSARTGPSRRTPVVRDKEIVLRGDHGVGELWRYPTIGNPIVVQLIALCKADKHKRSEWHRQESEKHDQRKRPDQQDQHDAPDGARSTTQVKTLLHLA
jgi:hypothetical protein